MFVLFTYIHSDIIDIPPNHMRSNIRTHLLGIRFSNLRVEQLRLRVHMRNAEFSYPLEEERVAAIFANEIEPEKFDYARAEAALN